MAEIRKALQCRVCGNRQLLPIVSLGSLFVSNFVGAGEQETDKVPLELVLCSGKNSCGLLQLRHSISSQHLYRNYWYRSGMNNSMKIALADIANKSESLAKLDKNDIVLDIGCNDGTLLRSYNASGIRKVGFEPARNLLKYAREGTTRIINDFFSFSAFNGFFPKERAKIVTAIAMFYDLDAPNSFVADVVKTLHPNGLFVIQMMDLVSMLEKNAFDNLVHEHVAYYSLSALEKLMAKHGLEVFDIELNGVNGGSLRAYIRHRECRAIAPFPGAGKRLSSLRAKEIAFELANEKPYKEFASRIEKIKKLVVSFITSEVSSGKNVFAYGASTKGNTLLQYFGLDSKLIGAAAERNPDKWGKKTVGTLIPIVSEEEARKMKPDFFLVLPWHFLKEFAEREKNFLRDGGKFIVPLPEFKVIGINETKK